MAPVLAVGVPPPHESRRLYPGSPSARFAAATAPGSSARADTRPEGGARKPAPAPASRVCPERLVRSPPVPSGALVLRPCLEPRDSAFAKPSSSTCPTSLITGETGEVLAPLSVEFRAAAAHAVRAGRFDLACALSERLSHRFLEPPAAELCLKWPPGAGVRGPLPKHSLALRERLSCRQASRPRPQAHGSQRSSLGWAACSSGALLRYARTTVVRQAERGLCGRNEVLTGNRRWRDPGPADGDAEVLRFRQRWNQAFAVGPSSALTVGRFASQQFEVHVDLVKAPEDALPTDGYLRPLMQIGITSRDLPFEDADSTKAHGEPLLTQEFLHESCWLVGMDGHVFEGDALRSTLPVAWADVSASTSEGAGGQVPAPSGGRLHICFVVEAAGALAVFAQGRLLCRSTEGVVSRHLLFDSGRIRPVVVLGPNIERVTLAQPRA